MGIERSQQAAPGVAACPRILIVEDDNDQRELIREALCMHYGQPAAKRITCVCNATECLAQDFNTVDVVLMDYKLPDTTGAELLKILSRRFPGILKIILTGYPADVDREEILALGAVECLYKPIQPDTLITIIKETLGKP